MTWILIAAGGTGGHLFPAAALAGVLAERGHDIELVTDARGHAFKSDFPARRVHIVASDTTRGRSPVKLARTACRLLTGVVQSHAVVRRFKPAAAVGFGGYPTVPPLFAAWVGRVPCVLHEANAVMGKANRLLAPYAQAVATGFPLRDLDPRFAARTHVTGNPVRPAVIAAAKTPYAPPEDAGPVRLLVFGGSQGASVFSRLVPEAVAALTPELRQRLVVVQQCREADLEETAHRYADLGVEAEVAPFFSDMPARIAAAHLVVARAGASTVSEVAVIGRPSILVPLPGARDQDQANNAAVMAAHQAAYVFAQQDLTAHRLAEILAAVINDPASLAAMAAVARALGAPHAADQLADLVEAVIAGKAVDGASRQDPKDAATERAP